MSVSKMAIATVLALVAVGGVGLMLAGRSPDFAEEATSGKPEGEVGWPKEPPRAPEAVSPEPPADRGVGKSMRADPGIKVWDASDGKREPKSYRHEPERPWDPRSKLWEMPLLTPEWVPSVEPTAHRYGDQWMKLRL